MVFRKPKAVIAELFGVHDLFQVFLNNCCTPRSAAFVTVEKIPNFTEPSLFQNRFSLYALFPVLARHILGCGLAHLKHFFIDTGSEID